MTSPAEPTEQTRCLVDFDHHTPGKSEASTRREYMEIRERCPIAHSPNHGGFDIIARYHDVRAALSDGDTFASGDGVFIPYNTEIPPTPPLEFDEPEHSKWREIINQPLTPQSVRELEPTITAEVNSLIDNFAQDGSAELVGALTGPLPAIVIGRMVGLNRAESMEIREIAEELFSAIGTDAFPSAARRFAAFNESKLADRRTNPRADFLTELSRGEVHGTKLNDEEVGGILLAYLVGGHHSTSTGIAGLIKYVLSEPGVLPRVRQDRKLISRAIEESLRLTTPLQLFARTTRAPAEIGGQQLPEGRRILLALAAANRDPREFDKPEEFVLERKRNRHLAFGGGMHVCQGQHLARAEMRIVMNCLFDRLPDIHLDGDVGHGGLAGGMLMPIVSLPVAFTPTTSG